MMSSQAAETFSYFSHLIFLSQIPCILKNSLVGESTQRISHFLIFFNLILLAT